MWLKLTILQVDADGSQSVLSYRYLVTPRQNVNAFKPKALEDSCVRDNLRAAIFGAIFAGKFNQLPTSAWCKVVWEAGIGKGCHQRTTGLNGCAQVKATYTYIILLTSWLDHLL